ncbi:RWD domain-containing protein 2A [Coccinella septempunctata]|uniref:RWD domain-containing protein 2A n=1 Tax=Coccinella septempunctata TaxID=41139 RepID=UPI001D0883EB|nr:RWD domain-containing protein 2A [Coccinella septempunctata]XP_044747909.1 RWD domain-containing protein 2A [Coccinella septempunctata]
MDTEKLMSNLEIQLSELETLQSMFYNPGEIKVEDPITLFEIRSFIDKSSDLLPSEIDLTINLDIDSSKFQLLIDLSHEYPEVAPSIFVRNEKLNRTQSGQLNKDIKEYMESLERGEPCIFSAICWLQENASKYVELSIEVKESDNKIEEPPRRLWIYSHHIYSKFKRKEILNQASNFNLNGFCLPGKPGIICVEGKTSDCNDWWQLIRSMPWKRIFCKVTEEFNGEEDFLKFNKFEEIGFQNNSSRGTHMDVGELSKYLNQHNCSYIFKDLFGVEAKLSGG